MSHNAKRSRERTATRLEAGMLADLEALTPPLIMGGAFLIGVVMFLRRQMGPRQQSEDDHDEADIEAGRQNADPGDAGHGPSTGDHKV
jgi:hypothetical protein